MADYWFISTKDKQNAKLTLLTCVLALAVILLGAYTRLTDAGLSCPDWPHCYGFVTAPHTQHQLQDAAKHYPLAPVDIKKAWTEMTHRYFAGAEGILILILAFSILKRSKDHQSIYIASLLIALLGTQVILGMLTVTEKLKPVIVLAHLLTGLSILSVLWWSYIPTQLRKDVFSFKKLSPTHLIWFWGAAIIVFVQITLGGWVSTHYAGLACIDFPYCNGKILPPLKLNELNSHLITIHMLHRIGALVTACYLVIYALFLLSMKSFKRIGGIVLLGVGLQLTLGILNILWLRPVSIALLHEAVAILLLLTVIYSLRKAYFESMDRRRYGS